MTAARYAVRPGAVEYGNVCPECAGPKHRQSKRCAACYYDARRRGEFPAPPVPQRKAMKRVTTGGSKGRPQPQDHSWRKQNALLFVKRRAAEMVDAGVRPATAGGRLRVHFTATDRRAT